MYTDNNMTRREIPGARVDELVGPEGLERLDQAFAPIVRTPRRRRSGRAMPYLETQAEAQDFEKRLEADPQATPFGIPVGEIPMENLVEAAGTEKAQDAFDKLAEQRRVNDLTLAARGLRSAR